MNLPQPVSNTDFFLVAIIDKLEEIRVAVIDVESELQKLSSATPPSPQPAKVHVTVDASKVAELVDKHMAQVIADSRVTLRTKKP